MDTHVIPASIGLHLYPGMSPTKDLNQRFESLPIERFESGDCTIESCLAHRIEISEARRLRYEAGDGSAPRRLLEINPEFLREPWIRRWLADPAALEASSRRGVGRPAGRAPRSEWNSMLLVAYVDALRVETGLSLNATFQKLGNEGRLQLSASRLRDLYYATRHANRGRSWLFT